MCVCVCVREREREREGGREGGRERELLPKDMFLLLGVQGSSHCSYTEVVGCLSHRPWPLYHHPELLQPDQSLGQRETASHVIPWAKISVTQKMVHLDHLWLPKVVPP